MASKDSITVRGIIKLLLSTWYRISDLNFVFQQVSQGTSANSKNRHGAVRGQYLRRKYKGEKL